MFISKEFSEAGVRFVELDMVDGTCIRILWNLQKQAYNIDKPISGLIQDLKDQVLKTQYIVWE